MRVQRERRDGMGREAVERGSEGAREGVREGGSEEVRE